MNPSTRQHNIRQVYFAPLAALPILFLASLGATAAITTLDDDLVLTDRDLPATPENVTLSFAEDDTFAGSNALYSWQSEQGAWVWGYDTNWKSMFLSQHHVLKLYNTDNTTGSENTPSITLDPGDGALGNVPASITIDGDKVITEGNSSTLLPTLLVNNFIPAQGSTASLGSADSFLLEGSHGGPGAIPKEGPGSRMMWYPEQGAFRAGRVTGNQWNTASIGAYSSAFGLNSSASGDYSSALGSSDAVGDFSIAMGSNAYAEAHHSTAIGPDTRASGEEASVAIGSNTNVNSFRSTVIGGYNENRHDTTDATTIAAAKTSWQGDDQHSIFEVGIGQADNDRKNALTILQDGSVEVGKSTATNNSVPLHIKANGDIIISKPQGDISMGNFQ